jgi:hypothetical protein
MYNNIFVLTEHTHFSHRHFSRRQSYGWIMCQDSVGCGISERSLVFLDWVYGSRRKVNGLTLPKRVCFCDKNGSDSPDSTVIANIVVMIPIICWVTSRNY